MEAREEDWVTQLFVASTHAYVFFFSDKGKVYVKKVYEIPLARAHEQGARDRQLRRHGAGREGRGHRRRCPRSRRASSSSRSRSAGQIKKTELDEYENFREKGIIGVKVEEGDQLLSAALTDGDARVRSSRPRAASRSASRRSRCGRWAARRIGVKGDRRRRGRRGGRHRGDAMPTRPHVLAVCERATASARTSRSSARRTAAARASSSSTRATATARSSA